MSARGLLRKAGFMVEPLGDPRNSCGLMYFFFSKIFSQHLSFLLADMCLFLGLLILGLSGSVLTGSHFPGDLFSMLSLRFERCRGLENLTGDNLRRRVDGLENFLGLSFYRC